MLVLATLLVGGCRTGGAEGSAGAALPSVSSTLSASDSSEPGPATGASDVDGHDIFAIESGSEEHLVFLQSCLADRGFRVEVDPLFGSVEAQVGAQEDGYNVAWDECRGLAIERGLDRPFRPKTADELNEAYGGLLLLQGCLVEHGYDVEAAPSLDAFVASGGMWDPYDALPFSAVSNLPADAPAWLIEQYEASRILRETCDPSVSYWVLLARDQ